MKKLFIISVSLLSFLCSLSAHACDCKKDEAKKEEQTATKP
jgi:hypothetical protein